MPTYSSDNAHENFLRTIWVGKIARKCFFCNLNLPFYGKYDDEPGGHESKHVGGVHKGLTRTIVILQWQPGA